MISTQRVIYCTNPECSKPINPVGKEVCTNCQTPLVYRYLWAVDSPSNHKEIGEKIAHRYEVITANIWLDTQPGLLPEVPSEPPPATIPYLKLYPQSLHIPQVYGIIPSPEPEVNDTLILENVPIDEHGHLYPAIADAWNQATAVRQVYWLWQILQLWQPLLELGVAGSLLSPENLRVQGWCVRLLELHHSEPQPLAQLAELWQRWAEKARPQAASELQNIIQQMQAEDADIHTISIKLNQLLLNLAGQLPLTLKVSGATDIGSELTQNEDACFPTNSDRIDDPLLPQVSIVCDGIGGHDGGEVASKLAIQSIKLQTQALIQEVSSQTEIVPPELLQQQIEASLRVVNNLISNSNNEQHREGIQRMGTTMVMAVQIPQKVETGENAHELYIVNVGDSRAYWITANYCQLLTVDDDVAGREVRCARSFAHQALQNPDANALTQALGTKDGEFLQPTSQRLIIEEDGILLLCSDGLSDNNWVEKSWQNYVIPIFTGEILLEDAVRQWIDLANQQNGHDNISLVITHCRVSPDYPVHVEQKDTQALVTIPEPVESSFTESSQALLDLDLPESPPTPAPVTSKSDQGKQWWLVLTGLLFLLLAGTSLSLAAWWQINPQSFQRQCQRLPQKVQKLCPPSN
ncbi:PP2C family protein-serine/threonine phosphatase [Calothrix rhizosoleniae]|uniref:PP2C family protein-serine/threonine phosphatase n=1 Tax=Calothrix rhizosoleniae TaxID=888997 RepID=UPI000B49FBC1|nr:protein phosphatase 2C domain-containing protein [Calothrix rhizosoleniae]